MKRIILIFILSLSFLSGLSAPENNIKFCITPDGKLEVLAFGIYNNEDPSSRRPFVQALTDFTDTYLLVFDYVSNSFGFNAHQMEIISDSFDGKMHKSTSLREDYVIIPQIELYNNCILERERDKGFNITQYVMREKVRIVTVDPLIDNVRDGVKSICVERGIKFDEVRFNEVFKEALKLNHITEENMGVER